MPAARTVATPSARAKEGCLEVIIHGVAGCDRGKLFHPNVFCQVWKSLRGNSYITRLGMTEIEFGVTDARFRAPNNTFVFDDLRWIGGDRDRADELDLIIECWDFGIVSGSTFLGQIVLNLETLNLLVGKGVTTMQLQPKNGTRDTTVKDVAGNMHGLVHLLLCGAHVMHDDDFEEDFVQVANIAAGRIMIELRQMRAGASDAIEHERQSLFDVAASSMGASMRDLRIDATEVVHGHYPPDCHAGEQPPPRKSTNWLKERRRSHQQAQDALSASGARGS